MSTLAFEKRWNEALSLDRDALVARIVAAVPDQPAGMEQILRFNRGWDRP
mgnify:CR=1 FL=1